VPTLGQLHLFEIPACRCGDVHCLDCGVDTIKAGEHYMVRDEAWPIGGLEGMLCIGCLERRIGRRLVPADFTYCVLNCRGRGSVCLQSRREPA
jgi:hypothetical protein